MNQLAGTADYAALDDGASVSVVSVVSVILLLVIGLIR